MLKSKKKEILIIIIILVIQTILFIIAGINKSYIHMDEAYSLGLANYNKAEIQENDDFYDTWHNKNYYEDYLKVNENEKNNFISVYENQKNDVHPPLYYLLLRIAMEFHVGKYSKWSGIILNIIIYELITIFTYLIIKKVLTNKPKCEEKSAALALLSSITLASISNVIYIRMYALATLNVVATTYFHLKLIDKKNSNFKLLMSIGIFALFGSLTHYYYLFYLAMLVIMMTIKYLKEKEYKELGKYLGTIILAGIISLIIFPYSIRHIFFSYRGEGAISSLINVAKALTSIIAYIFIINVYMFNNTLIIMLLFILFLILYKKIKKIKVTKDKNKYIKYIALPTLFYTLLVAIVSPYITLRYVMPVSNFIFILVLYYFISISKTILKKRTLNIVIISTFLLIIIMPYMSNIVIDLALGEKFRNERETSYSSKSEIVRKLKDETSLPIDIALNFTDVSLDNILLCIKDFRLEPEVLYSNKREITGIIKDNSNLPAIYIFDSNHNRFLDDILLFTYINESYIAKDLECSEEKIKQITLGKDTSNGILIFINDGQDNEYILDIIKRTLKLENIQYLKRLNSCDVYLIK